MPNHFFGELAFADIQPEPLLVQLDSINLAGREVLHMLVYVVAHRGWYKLRATRERSFQPGAELSFCF